MTKDDTAELPACLFCGSYQTIMVEICASGVYAATLMCKFCAARGPVVMADAIEKASKRAVETYNDRSKRNRKYKQPKEREY